MLNKTGVNFMPGSGLKSSDLNRINDTVNKLVDIINSLLKDRCNINIEILGNTRELSLEEALELVPSDRRVRGITIKFNQADFGWCSYIYTGDVWEDIDSWTKLEFESDVIDGGIINGS